MRGEKHVYATKKRPRSILLFALPLLALLLLGSLVSLWSVGQGSGAVASAQRSADNGPQNTSYPLQEGFESGTLNTFSSVIGVCHTTDCGWSVVTSDRHSGTYSAFAP